MKKNKGTKERSSLRLSHVFKRPASEFPLLSEARTAHASLGPASSRPGPCSLPDKCSHLDAFLPVRRPLVGAAAAALGTQDEVQEDACRFGAVGLQVPFPHGRVDLKWCGNVITALYIFLL